MGNSPNSISKDFELRRKYEIELGYIFQSDEEWKEFIDAINLQKKPLQNDSYKFQHQELVKEYNTDQFITHFNIGPSQPLTLLQLSQQIVKENINSPRKKHLLDVIMDQEEFNIVSYNLNNKIFVDYIESITNGENEYYIDKLRKEDNSYVLRVKYDNTDLIFYATEPIVHVKFYTINDLGGEYIYGKQLLNSKTLAIVADFEFEEELILEIHYHNNQVQRFIIVQ